MQHVLKKQRLLVTIDETGQIVNTQPVPDDAYIAHINNIETIIQRLLPDKILCDKVEIYA